MLDQRPTVPSEGSILGLLSMPFALLPLLLLVVVVMPLRMMLWTLASEDLTQNCKSTSLPENHSSLLLWLGRFRW